MPRPHLVLATQNPVELEGTFPLPEAQLDRFLLRVRVGYPSEDEEEALLHRFKNDAPFERLQPIVAAEQVLLLQQVIRQVQWQPEVERYLLAIVRATRSHSTVTLGVSPRGTLALYRACEAYAAMQGRDFVQPEDVKHLAPSVLAHRLLTTTRARLRGSAAEAIILAGWCARSVYRRVRACWSIPWLRLSKPSDCPLGTLLVNGPRRAAC